MKKAAVIMNFNADFNRSNLNDNIIRYGMDTCEKWITQNLLCNLQQHNIDTDVYLFINSHTADNNYEYFKSLYPTCHIIVENTDDIEESIIAEIPNSVRRTNTADRLLISNARQFFTFFRKSKYVIDTFGHYDYVLRVRPDCFITPKFNSDELVLLDTDNTVLGIGVFTHENYNRQCLIDYMFATNSNTVQLVNTRISEWISDLYHDILYHEMLNPNIDFYELMGVAGLIAEYMIHRLLTISGTNIIVLHHKLASFAYKPIMYCTNAPLIHTIHPGNIAGFEMLFDYHEFYHGMFKTFETSEYYKYSGYQGV